MSSGRRLSSLWIRLSLSVIFFSFHFYLHWLVEQTLAWLHHPIYLIKRSWHRSSPRRNYRLADLLGSLPVSRFRGIFVSNSAYFRINGAQDMLLILRNPYQFLVLLWVVWGVCWLNPLRFLHQTLVGEWLSLDFLEVFLLLFFFKDRGLVLLNWKVYFLNIVTQNRLLKAFFEQFLARFFE